MHRQFVDAIYEIGVSHAAPSVIIENMSLAPAAPEQQQQQQHESPSSAGTTTTTGTSKSKNKLSERVKSHLQKYRKNKEKSKQEFLLEYDAWMQKALTVVGGVSAAARTSLVSTPAAVIEMVGETTATTTATAGSMKAAKVDGDDSTNKPHVVLGGALPAFLTYSVMLEEEHKHLLRQRGAVGVSSVAAQPVSGQQQYQQQQQLQQNLPSATAAAMATNPSAFPMARTGTTPSVFLPADYSQYFSGSRLPIPALTEEERKSSLGVSISHVVGLFHSVTHYLLKERTQQLAAQEGVAAPLLETKPMASQPACASERDAPQEQFDNPNQDEAYPRTGV